MPSGILGQEAKGTESSNAGLQLAQRGAEGIVLTNARAVLPKAPNAG
jgi:hypothetical protein